MRTYPMAPPLPGQGNARNLVSQPDGLEACPCCGAVWKNGRPWSETTMNPVEVAEKMGISPQAVTQRIRSGSIAAYLGAGAGGRNKYVIPVFEYERVAAQEVADGGPRPEKVAAVQDLGVKRG